MPSTRKKYASDKEITLLSASQFNRIESTDQVFPQFTVLPKTGKSNASSILEPIVGLIKPQLCSRSIEHNTLNYKRYLQQYPCTDQYELTEIDLKFLEINRGVFQMKGSEIKGEDLLREGLLFLQKSCKRIGRQEDYRWWVKKWETLNKSHLKYTQSLEILIFSYWCSRRKQLKYPLIRNFWSAAENVNELYMIYRPRPQAALRPYHDHKKLNGHLIAELGNQFTIVRKLCSKIQARQYQQQKQLSAVLQRFTHQMNLRLGNYTAENQITGWVAETPLGNLCETEEQQSSKQTTVFPSQYKDDVRLQESATLEATSEAQDNHKIINYYNISQGNPRNKRPKKAKSSSTEWVTDYQLQEQEDRSTRSKQFDWLPKKRDAKQIVIGQQITADLFTRDIRALRKE